MKTLLPLDINPLDIRALLGEDAFPQDYVPSTPIPEEQARRTGLDLKSFIGRMKRFEAFIICRYLEGYSPELIADMLTAHPETIRIRIRRAGLFPTKTRGKPKKGAKHPLVQHYRVFTKKTYSGSIPTSFFVE
jgi:hypothetical protein